MRKNIILKNVINEEKCLQLFTFKKEQVKYSILFWIKQVIVFQKKKKMQN